jgi:hypothetical protein
MPRYISPAGYSDVGPVEESSQGNISFSYTPPSYVDKVVSVTNKSVLTFPEVKSRLISDISVLESKFDSNIRDLISVLTARAFGAIADPETANAVFDLISTAYPVGIGSGTSGIYGTYVHDLTSAIEKASQGINLFIASQIFSSQSEVDAIESQVNSLSDFISSASSTSTDKISKSIETIAASFSSMLTIAQTRACKNYLNGIIDSFLGAIDRADEKFNADIDRLLAIYKEYKTLPSDIVEATDHILTDISTAYNDSITAANKRFTDKLSIYKYFTIGAQSILDSGQSRISAAVSKSNANVLSRISLINSTLTTALSVIDYSMAYAIADLAFKLFKESVRLNSKLKNIVGKHVQRLDDMRGEVRRYVKMYYVPQYVDGYAYRNSKSSLSNGVASIISKTVSEVQKDYNDYANAFRVDYGISLENLQSYVIQYITTHTPGITQSQMDSISSRLSAVISSENDRVSLVFTTQSNLLSAFIDSLYRYSEYILDSYYKSKPLLRFEGDVSLPSSITRTADNIVRFTVTNIGESSWVGWFGIKFTETSEEVSQPYVSRYNRRAGFITIAPSETAKVIVTIPGYRLKRVGVVSSVPVLSVITNTYAGGST